MSRQKEIPTRVTYTTRAREIALKYPYITAVWTHINFWTIAYLLMFGIVFLGVLGITSNLGIDLDFHFAPPLISALFMGISYGFIIGSINYWLEKKVFGNLPFWKVIAYQTVLSTLVLLALVFISRIYIVEKLLVFFSVNYLTWKPEEGWQFLIAIILLYTFMMSILISFINQMNKKFGPGILIPMLFGRFRSPREEERVFMFLDLKNSTSFAEKLGHLKYSSFIRDCFQDINSVVKDFYAEIYQYVGDEIVLSWEAPIAIKDSRFLSFYFSCREYLQSREDYYQKNYGITPLFKAGVHMGLVTVVEVGDLKRDIAYHGDTLNVTARIENLCKTMDENFLISSTVHDRLPDNKDFRFVSLGNHHLKGRKENLEIFRVELS